MYPTITPAYGRDYTSAKADWEAGKDFILQDVSSPWDGRPINKQDAVTAGLPGVNIRFARMTKVAVVEMKR
jgi:hypothetical protein